MMDSLSIPHGQLTQEERSKLLPSEGLKTLRQKHKTSKIVQCHGVFDLLHAGHIAYFQSAKKYGGILVVTITADEFVNKGIGRPYFNAWTRARVVAALDMVDYVAINPFPTAVPAIEVLAPDYYVKGPDYKDMSSDVSGAIYEEKKAVERCGGKLVFTGDPIHSSSSLINKFFTPFTPDQLAVIEQAKMCGGMPKLEELLDTISKEKVCIIGEPIVDTYSFCLPESISSKGSCVSAKFLYEENYAGGALAIANHICDFVKETTLVLVSGTEPYFQQLISEKLDKRVKVIPYEVPTAITPKKKRYISHLDDQRVFEITHIENDQWQAYPQDKFCQLIKQASASCSTTILADFGHGLFEGPVISTTDELDGYICLNVQTNSSNFAFNPFTKHRRFSYLCCDTKEARIAYHDRFSKPLEIAKRMKERFQSFGGSFTLTLGSDGSLYFPAMSASEHHSPAFTDTIVDTTGAGDALFAISSLLVKGKCPDPMVPFLGNIFAGLKTKIMGNKAAVSIAQFVKSVSAILK